MSLIMAMGFLQARAAINSDLSKSASSKDQQNFGIQEILKITIKGKVTSSEGEPLPGATILVKGTTSGTVTDINGNFSLDVPTGNETILITYVGYNSEEVALAGKTEFNITLSPLLAKLDEVVVVGYGTQKKSVITGAIAKVNSEDLAQSKDLRVEQTLQGKTAGVVIINNSGQPGDNATIRIRGVGTNNDPDPLFLLDGMPMPAGGLDFLNNSDVESVEVLKDASSAAIYGTRGANGVIMITTKQGKKGQKFSVTYDGSYGTQNPWRRQKLLNSQQYLQIFEEASKNDGNKKFIIPDSMLNYIGTNHWNTDWQNEMYYKNAPKTSHLLTLTGAGENSTYSSSLGYYSQDGIVAKGKSNFERVTYRLNTTRGFGILTVGSNINIVDIKKKGIDANNQFGLGMNQALNMPPIIPVKFANGNYAMPSNFNIGLQEIYNPIAQLSIYNQSDEIVKAVGNVWAELKMFKYFVFRTTYGADYSVESTANYTPVYYFDANHRNDSLDILTKEIVKSFSWNFENTLTYKESFGKSDITALVGITRLEDRQENMYGLKKDFKFHDLEHGYFDNSVNESQDKLSGYFRDHTLQSYFGRLNYNYDEKYLLEGSYRIDGSSRFGSANKYAKFPAYSAGWVVTREDFFPKTDLLSFLKLRGSWGKNGSENIPDFRYASLMTDGLFYYFGDNKTPTNGILPAFNPNASLKWETSKQLDLGTDMGLMSNRFSLAFDYYNKITDDWLIQAPISNIAGNNAPWINGGKVQNRGYELELGYKNKIAKDLTFNIEITASTNKSKVLDIPNAQHVLEGGSGILGQSNLLRADVGSSLGYFWGYKVAGIVQNDSDLVKAKKIAPSIKKGDLIFVDVNGDGKITEDDRTNIGSPYPKFTGGLNLTVNWKIIDLGMFWYTALGQKVYDANRRADLGYSNFTTEVMNRWHVDSANLNATYSEPRVTVSDKNGNYSKVSEYYLKKASFLRLKSLTLGISMPKKWASFLKVSKIRVYYTGENLLTFTKYPGMEVEVGGTPFGLADNYGNPTNAIGIDHGDYPVSKTHTIGINVEF